MAKKDEDTRDVFDKALDYVWIPGAVAGAAIGGKIGARLAKKSRLGKGLKRTVRDSSNPTEVIWASKQRARNTAEGALKGATFGAPIGAGAIQIATEEARGRKRRKK